jgi:hypothetical protein
MVTAIYIVIVIGVFGLGFFTGRKVSDWSWKEALMEIIREEEPTAAEIIEKELQKQSSNGYKSVK